MKIWLLIIGLTTCAWAVAQPLDTCDYVLEGTVYDIETGEGLPYATITVLGKTVGTITDAEGKYKIRGLCDVEFDLQASFVGYKTLVHHHDVHHAVPDFYLAPDQVALKSVVVEASKINQSNTYAKDELAGKELSSIKASNIGQLAASLSGVTMRNTGQNIALPVIHGLYGSRILVINDEIRHQYQSWGSDHAPEINLNQIDRLEVVKGASTVKYGPDALGGVLLIFPRELELSQPIHGNVSADYATNGRGGSTDFFLAKGTNRWAFDVQGSWSKHGDLRAPDYFLTNTGMNEYGYGLATRYHKNHFDLNVKYSRVHQQLGVLRWSVNGSLEDLQSAMSGDDISDTANFTYHIKQPYQETDHQVFLAKSKLQYENQEFTFRYAFQINHRQEFDLRKGTQTPIPNIDLDLRVQTFDADWFHPQLGNFSGQIGAQWQYHDNNNIPGTNTAQFVPNYNYQRIGLFAVESVELGRWMMEFGARYDYHYMSARGIFQSERYDQELTFHNVTGSAGLVKSTGSGHTFRFNIGNAWRAPNMAELYSFGRHQSVYQYGMLTYDVDAEGVISTSDQMLSVEAKNVKSEVSYKVIFSDEFLVQDVFQLNASIYVNLIDHYFYRRPVGISKYSRGVFPYFVYDQDQAFFYGGDFQLKWKHNSMFRSTFGVNYVYAKNSSTGEYFIDTPPLNLNYKLSYELNTEKWGLLSFHISPEYFFKQWFSPRVIDIDEILDSYDSGENLFAGREKLFDFMAPPSAYFLIGCGASIEKNGFSFGFTLNNAFNTNYRSYTDRMRYYADEQGRNLILSLAYEF